MSWRERALCRAPAHAKSFREHWVAAEYSESLVADCKAICAKCPVLDECREWGLSLAVQDVAGIVGGLTPQERTLAQRKKGGEVSPTPSLSIENWHGTEGGYSRHWRAGEKPCDECAAVHREGQMLRNRRRREMERLIEEAYGESNARCAAAVRAARNRAQAS